VAFREKAEEKGIGPVFFHAVYLINLGTSSPSLLEKGVESLVSYMKLAAEVGAAGVIVHPGSHKGAGYEAILQQTVSSLERVLESAPEGPWLTLENTAGMGQHIGARFEELGRILAAARPACRRRLKICLDTQHSFAAGYDLSTGRGLDAMLAEFDETIGLDNLVAVHANDSKYPLGAGVDRHENIGQGHIGLGGFENIMANPAFRDLPFLLEVPGFDNKGPDRKNMEILGDIRARVAPGG
jgi:deoxyribonuclease-4